jgi:hypothetical protein
MPEYSSPRGRGGIGHTEVRKPVQEVALHADATSECGGTVPKAAEGRKPESFATKQRVVEVSSYC